MYGAFGPNFSLMFLIHLFLYAGVYCISLVLYISFISEEILLLFLIYICELNWN